MNHLTRDQENALAMYTAQYNQLNSHVDMLLSMLETVKNNMDDIVYGSHGNHHHHHHGRRVYSPPSVNRRTSRTRPSSAVRSSSVHPSFRRTTTGTTATTTTTTQPTNDLLYNFNYYTYEPSYNNSNSSSTSTSAIANDLSAFVANFLNTPIVVRPTADQIAHASRLVRYGNIVNPVSDACPISLERFTNDDEVRQLLHCGHIFHTHQFQTWFSSNVKCPVCRHDIRTYRRQPEQPTPTPTPTPTQEAEAHDGVEELRRFEEQQRRLREGEQYGEEEEEEERKECEEEAQRRLREEAREAEERYRQQTRLNQEAQPILPNNFDSLLRDMFTTLLNPNHVPNDRFMVDPSNNMVYFETTFGRPANNNNNNGM
jgi:hypothetical protein